MAPKSQKNPISECYFKKAWQDWDLERLINDLGIETRPAQQRNLRALLLGLSPKKVASEIGLKSTNGLKPAFCELYKDIAYLTGADNVCCNSVALVLRNAGYHKNISTNKIFISTPEAKKEVPNSDYLEQDKEIHQPPTEYETEYEFVGRDLDLTNLEKISTKAKIVLIKAGGGVGKSTLAEIFFKKYFQLIEINLALSVDDNIPAEERLRLILKELNQEIHLID